jgi:hypothetical protein
LRADEQRQKKTGDPKRQETERGDFHQGKDGGFTIAKDGGTRVLVT